MVVYGYQLLAVARLLNVTVQDIVDNKDLYERVGRFFEEFNS